MKCIVKIYFVTSKIKYNTYSARQLLVCVAVDYTVYTGTQARELHGSQVLYLIRGSRWGDLKISKQ